MGEGACAWSESIILVTARGNEFAAAGRRIRHPYAGTPRTRVGSLAAVEDHENVGLDL